MQNLSCSKTAGGLGICSKQYVYGILAALERPRTYPFCLDMISAVAALATDTIALFLLGVHCDFVFIWLRIKVASRCIAAKAASAV